MHDLMFPIYLKHFRILMSISKLLTYGSISLQACTGFHPERYTDLASFMSREVHHFAIKCQYQCLFNRASLMLSHLL